MVLGEAKGEGEDVGVGEEVLTVGDTPTPTLPSPTLTLTDRVEQVLGNLLRMVPPKPAPKPKAPHTKATPKAKSPRGNPKSPKVPIDNTLKPK